MDEFETLHQFIYVVHCEAWSPLWPRREHSGYNTNKSEAQKQKEDQVLKNRRYPRTQALNTKKITKNQQRHVARVFIVTSSNIPQSHHKFRYIRPTPIKLHRKYKTQPSQKIDINMNRRFNTQTPIDRPSIYIAPLLISLWNLSKNPCR